MKSPSWITLYPEWYLSERQLIADHYPEFRLDEGRLAAGQLVYVGELKVRPPGGTRRHPVRLLYPDSTPFEKPTVIPLETLPEFGDNGTVAQPSRERMFDHRHQMPNGPLCLFQRDTRSRPEGDVIRGIDALRRAEQWFLGLHTGHWPRDSAEAELESHFPYSQCDILIGNSFFRDDLGMYGRFVAVVDLPRVWRGSTNMLPLLMTALTDESGVIVRVYDARADLAGIYPWLKNEAWGVQTVAEVYEARSNGTDPLSGFGHYRGYWWSLVQEPTPFRSGEGLLRVLSQGSGTEDVWPLVSALVGSDLTTAKVILFGLRYPGRHGGYEWLITQLILDNKPERGGFSIRDERTKREVFNKAQVDMVRVHSVRPEILHLRNTSVVDSNTHNKCVALVGLGALGSKVAELLAQAGVGKVRLCDMDCLTVGNVVRHVGGVDDYGETKVSVVSRRLLEINPYLEFTSDDILDGSITRSLDKLAAFIAPADLTISTTADESVEAILNQIAILNRKQVLYGRALRRGSIGRVFLVRPKRDACKACLATYAQQGRAGLATPDDWTDVIEQEEDILLHECGRPVIPASAVDLSFIAALIARVALDVLEGNDGEINHWVWTRSPASDVDPRLDQDLQTVSGRLMPVFGCYACQEPGVVKLVIGESVKKQLHSLVKASPTVETGGILIGFVNEQRGAVAVVATEPGPKAIQTRTLFSRDIAYVQAELDKATEVLGYRGKYIGEWHSHLDPDPVPSHRDIESLVGIANAQNYLTRNPVMLIVGLDPSSKQVRNLQAWSFSIGGRMYEIELEVVSDEVIDQLKAPGADTDPGVPLFR